MTSAHVIALHPEKPSPLSTLSFFSILLAAAGFNIDGDVI
jgi:hypothetical protein